MKSPQAIVYASFSSVDLAELAARKIKQTVPQVHSIAIRYRNNPPVENGLPTHEIDDSLVLTAGAMGNGFVPTSGVGAVLFAGAYNFAEEASRYQHDDCPLISTESRLVIKTDADHVHALEAQLINLGGVSIKSSIKPY